MRQSRNGGVYKEDSAFQRVGKLGELLASDVCVRVHAETVAPERQRLRGHGSQVAAAGLPRLEAGP